MTPEAVQTALNTTVIGNRIEVHRQVSSTNDLARDAARRGEKEGLVVLAEEQTAGRGRMGRIWIAPPGCCILCSVLLRPHFPSQHAFHITMAASLAIYRALNSVLSPQSSVLTIKWPNDVLVNGRKVSGVLSEGEFVGGEWSFAIVGFGINVSMSRSDLEGLQAIAPNATSLSVETGTEIDRAVLLARVLEELERLYLALQNGAFNTVHEEWVSKVETIGRRVVVDQGRDRVNGIALRVDTDGALVVRTNDGLEHRVLAGDVI